MTQPASAPARNVPGRRLGRDLAYNLSAFFTGTIAFTLAVTLFSLGIATVIIYIGIFILLGALFTATFFAGAERRIATWATGQLPPTYYRRSTADSTMRRMLDPLRDGQRWKDLIHAVVSFPVRVLAFSVTISWIAAALGGITQWIWERYLPESNVSLLDILRVDPAYHVWIQIGLGLAFLFTLPPISRGLALLQRALAVGLLTNERQAMREEADRLTNSRSSVIAAEADTLRKIERDIHDGPQQRMVRMNMDLEAAKRRLDPQDSATKELLDSALEQSRGALAELRALSRGIAPPVLVDRGLVPALEASAARSPIPVIVEATEPAHGRFAVAIEQAAYFAGVESLTNAAKHSRATGCRLLLDVADGHLALQVRDDGVGGAHLGKGTGLAGLADRLAGVDGTLTVDSPENAGTVISVSIPLGTDG
ncbi:sensor histidine kinase [Paeniglutamicibacter kerguelensis]|uniref:histidine kinase n=1 Tax=Paeniglutamicibacter kerguelensis TaxID=254788 RepID=A0ABS4XJP6_9MICC|nr:sensor histidine kinase [Paeniglutamicibacter kerguelensis]MBP2388591.1 signal transduction histidine kinase [Paeniglutamicibacter kerguelensis]